MRFKCKARPCVPQMFNGRPLRVGVSDSTGSQGIVYCRRCRWQMTGLELMRPRLSLVATDRTKGSR